MCCCDESTSCIYHILKFLDTDRWDEYFNGKKNSKVSPGAIPLSFDQRNSVIWAFSEYKNMCCKFEQLSHDITYRPQHNRDAIHPAVSCKCYYCLGNNLGTIKQVIQLMQCKKFPILCK